MRGTDWLHWVWIALAIVAAAACGGDTAEQGAASSEPPAAEQAAVVSGEAQPQTAEQIAGSEPVQWSDARCLNRMTVAWELSEGLDTSVTDLHGRLARGDTAHARYGWELNIQPTLDELALAHRQLTEHCREAGGFEEFVEANESYRRKVEAELAFIADNEGEFDPGAAGWTAEQCDRRFRDVFIYAATLPDYALVDLEDAVNRDNTALARRIRETRIKPVIDEIRDAFSDVSEHCEQLPAAEAESGETFEDLLQLGQDLLDAVERRYAELAE